MRPMIEHSRLLELVRYDPETGVFTNLQSRRRAPQGKRAGGVDVQTGYRRMNLDKVSYYEHRLAWFYIYKEWPEELIDHINGIRDDNSIANLRLATYCENNQNMTVTRSRDKSRLIGTVYHGSKPRTKPWQGVIKIHGKAKSLGYYETQEQAHKAYLDEKKKMHPFSLIEAERGSDAMD